MIQAISEMQTTGEANRNKHHHRRTSKLQSGRSNATMMHDAASLETLHGHPLHIATMTLSPSIKDEGQVSNSCPLSHPTDHEASNRRPDVQHSQRQNPPDKLSPFQSGRILQPDRTTVKGRGRTADKPQPTGAGDGEDGGDEPPRLGMNA